MIRIALTFLALCAGSVAASAAEVVFMIGEKEYQTWETVPAFFEKELKPKGYTATFITAPPSGDARNDFPGLEKALAKADLLFVSVRRRAPKEGQMQAVKDFLEAGKPLMAIRTSSHAFDTKGKPPAGHGDWVEFDTKVLAGNYHGHYGSEVAQVSADKENASYSILKGVGSWGTTRLYKNLPLQEGATALLWATIPGKPSEPVAWTHQYGPKKARVFYTSLGDVEDFKQPSMSNLLQNAINWALAKE